MNSSEISIASLPDKDLARLFKNGSDDAFNELVFRYIGTISYIAGRYSAGGYDQSDFVQEGLLGLMSACLSYSEDESTSFKSYMSVVVERRFISIIRRLGARKSVPESALVRIESISDSVEDKSQSPEELVLCREQLDTL
ncbi:MAG: sigma-70 family RNA polymerase sigma factor, partial [Ruminococcus sp.]|nr:sigma-70 family RNA polymerase sigma factor [Ruminococcus sp.]